MTSWFDSSEEDRPIILTQYEVNGFFTGVAVGLALGLLVRLLRR